MTHAWTTTAVTELSIPGNVGQPDWRATHYQFYRRTPTIRSLNIHAHNMFSHHPTAVLDGVVVGSFRSRGDSAVGY
jgi:hypothetical protein